jgi:hypothetical protein
MYGDPAQIDTKLMVWQHLEKLKYPFARNVVESLKQLRDQMIQAQQAQMMQAQGGAAGAMMPVGAGASPDQVMNIGGQ